MKVSEENSRALENVLQDKIATYQKIIESHNEELKKLMNIVSTYQYIQTDLHIQNNIPESVSGVHIEMCEHCGHVLDLYLDMANGMTTYSTGDSLIVTCPNCGRLNLIHSDNPTG